MHAPGDAANPRQIVLTALKRGALRGVRTAVLVTCSIVPFFLLTWAAERTGVLAGLGNVIAPVMALFGLPGTAALPLVAGFMGGFLATGALRLVMAAIAGMVLNALL